jgi:hypothetical protein
MAALRAFLVCVGLAVFTWLGFQYFPGHTYLQADTQAYLPMLERISSPGYLARDIVATHPHVSFTIYDEVTLGLRKTAHQTFERALVEQQLLFRAAGLLGIYLLATAVGTTPAYAFTIAAFLNLGATLSGPAVLLVEYEPIPRGFAFELVLLAVGLLAHRLPLLAGLAGGLAFVYHPPTAALFWGIVLLAMIFDREARRHWKPLLLALLIACLLLANVAQLQPDAVENQNLLGRLSQSLMDLQHFRNKFSFVSLWAPRDIWHYLGICLCAIWASTAIWPNIRREMRWFFIGMPLGGVLSVPLSYLLLERLHLAVVPQFQPARALVYTVAFASMTCGMAAAKAAMEKRPLAATAWMLVVVAMPLDTRWFDLLRIHDARSSAMFAVWVGLALLAGFAMSHLNRNWLRPAAIAVPALAAFAIPMGAGVRNYQTIDKQPVTEVAEWASQNSWGSSMFLFPDAGHTPYPGIFRAISERAVYVDWESGSQVNYFETFAQEWYSRYQQTMNGEFTAARFEDMLSLPIDYYVLTRKNALLGARAVYQNGEYVVYEAQDLRNSSVSLRLSGGR